MPKRHHVCTECNAGSREPDKPKSWARAEPRGRLVCSKCSQKSHIIVTNRFDGKRYPDQEDSVAYEYGLDSILGGLRYGTARPLTRDWAKSRWVRRY